MSVNFQPAERQPIEHGQDGSPGAARASWPRCPNDSGLTTRRVSYPHEEIADQNSGPDSLQCRSQMTLLPRI